MKIISILKEISVIIDLLEKKNYSLAIYHLDKLINQDFLYLCNYVSQSNYPEIDEFLKNVIRYHKDKKLNLSVKSDIILYGLEEIRKSLCSFLNLQEEINTNLNDINLYDLNEIIHNHIYGFFTEHFAAICSFDRDRAYQTWNKLSFYLEKHSYIEDSIVEPIYVHLTSKLGVPKGGEHNHFIYEHKILKKLSSDIEHLIGKMGKNYEYIVNNLDQYFYFKNLWIHHGLRERNIFYKFLEDNLDYKTKEELKKELIKSIREWDF